MWSSPTSTHFTGWMSQSSCGGPIGAGGRLDSSKELERSFKSGIRVMTKAAVSRLIHPETV